jgi:hypothetical protein
MRVMQWRTPLLVALLACGIYNGWQRFELRAVHPADGVLAPDDPRQGEAVADPVPLRQGRWLLTPRATYDITARILAREDYRYDTLADLVPVDLALGWGPMSDNAMLRHFDIEQSVRFYSWRPRGALPLPRATVITHSANTHIIPADAPAAALLARLRVGEVVRLRGWLVDGRRDDGAFIRTSLTRDDSGAGACEVLLASSVEVE